jgi:hypothetical protein
MKRTTVTKWVKATGKRRRLVTICTVCKHVYPKVLTPKSYVAHVKKFHSKTVEVCKKRKRK